MQREQDGTLRRDHLRASAKRGNAAAIRALTAPDYPRRYTYLLDWYHELHARRGAGPHGPAPLTWLDFDAWARCTEHSPSAWEWRVLSLLDDAFFWAQQPPTETAKPDAPVTHAAWPTKKETA